MESDDCDVEVEYFPEVLLLDDENFAQFADVFDHFNAAGVDEEVRYIKNTRPNLAAWLDNITNITIPYDYRKMGIK